MDAARKYVEKGQNDKAIKEYLRVVREDPKDVRVWLKIGDLYAKKGSKIEAIETYLKVAKFYSEQGFDLKAVAVYKQILKLDPRLIEVNLKLAELYRQMGLMKEAMEQFEAVAGHFHREGKTKEALATVRQLVDLDPENVATRIKLAELYSKEGMVQEAITEFTQACDYLRANNRQDDFVKVAERLLWHKPDNIDLSRELASLYLRRQDPRRALQKLQVCFKANSRDVDTLALLAQAFQALDQKSKTVQVLKELARVFDEDNEHDRAAEVHQKILAFSPNDADAKAYLSKQSPESAAPAPSASPPPVQPPAPQPPSPQRLAMSNNDFPQRRRHNPTGSMPLVDPRSLPFNFANQGGPAPAPAPAPDIVVEDDFVEISDESGYDSSAEGELHAEEIQKILTDADVYVRYNLHQKAVDHLRRVFDLDPDNIEAREQLRAVLIQQGREQEAFTELMRLAELTVNLDPTRAEGYLQEILAIDGTYQPAFELADRLRLRLGGGHQIEVVDDLDSTGVLDGGVAPIEELDFSDIDFDDGSPDIGGSNGVSARRASTGAGDDAFEFEIEDDPPPAQDPHGVTMEISVNEVEQIFDVLEDDQGEDLNFDTRNSTSNPAYGYDSGYGEEPVFDPADAAAFDAEPGYPAHGAMEYEEPVFDPADAAAFDAEREQVSYQYEGSAGASSPAEPGYEQASFFDEAPPTVQISPGDLDLFGDEFDAHNFDAEPVADPSQYADDFGHHNAGNGGFVDPAFAPTQLVTSDMPSMSETVETDDLLSTFSDEPRVETVDTGVDVIEEKILQATQPAVEPIAGIEDDLDEADFFVAQSLYDEAGDIIRNLLNTYPEHPLLLAKLRDIENLRHTSGPPSYESEAVDYSGLDILDGLDEDGEAKPTVLLENPVDENDADTHFDLGLAYKEMGLYNDAINVFKKVAESPAKEVQSRLMMGLCHREQGNYVEAIQQFKQGLHAPEILEREQLSLYYEIAMTYEGVGDPKEALYFYSLIRKKDPNYRDMLDRVAAIETQLQHGDPRHLDI